MQDGDMTQAPRTSGGGSSKTPLIAGFVLLLVAIAAGWFVMKNGFGGGAPVKKVASLDSDAIYQLPEFTKAQEDLTKKSDGFKKQLEEWAKKQNPQSDAEKAEVMRQLQEKAGQYEQELQQEKNKILTPLQKKAEAAIAAVAREHNYKVVLDKRIVVYGVDEITEEVKKKFQDKAELKLPAEDSTQDSPIAYFDQDVVRNLKAFQEVDLKLATTKNELSEEFARRVKDRNLSPAEQANLQKELMLRLEAKQQEMTAPLIQAVNQSVSEAAEKNNVALVLDKVHVMYGGRNLTDEVVDSFLKKTGSKGTPATESTSKPKTETPSNP